jgi:hypothetical protein
MDTDVRVVCSPPKIFDIASYTYTLGRWPSKERHRTVDPDLVSRLRRWCESIPAHQWASIPIWQRSHAQNVTSLGSNPRRPTNLHAPVADGEANGLQSRDSRFESVPGAMHRNAKWRSGLIATQVLAGSTPARCSRFDVATCGGYGQMVAHRSRKPAPHGAWEFESPALRQSSALR